MPTSRTSMSLLLVLVLASSACAASDANCDRLGDKFVELYGAQLDEKAQELAPEVLANAAEAGRAEVVQQCKEERFSKQSIARCLEATTLAEFKQC